MKTKPILIGVISGVVILAAAFFVKAKYFDKPQAATYDRFLQDFNRQVANKNTDSLATYFDVVWDDQLLTQFLKVITNQSSVNPGEPAQLKLALNIADCSYVKKENGNTDIIVPVKLTHTTLPAQLTKLTFTVQPKGIHEYTIVQVDNQDFISDYLAFENKARMQGIPDKDIYSPLTLQAFKSAEKLKAKYDSVLWFSHINKQTYFYVIKGKWDYYDPDSAKTYKMGLVNPQLQEIIPAEYDLVYNINGSLNGLVEVEKDHKRGFYDLNGNIVVPVEYDQIFPLVNSEHLGALRKGDSYYWLEKDYSTSEADVNINELLTMLPPVNWNNLSHVSKTDIMELNSRDNHSSVLISPSYLTDLNLVSAIKHLKNPLRRNVEFFDASSQYKVAEAENLTKADTGRFQALVYSIRDYFIGGRSEFYDTKNVVLVDKQGNRAFSKDIYVDYTMSDGGEAPVKCDGYSFRAVTDTLFELKAGASMSLTLCDDTYIQEMPMYHYLYVHNNKLQEKPTKRLFAFTQFVKMDESYVTGCYYYNEKVISALTPAMLRYMKNEIYADYNYIFKDKKWASIFADGMVDYKAENAGIDDRLTEIDRYNLNWINQRLNAQSTTKLAAR